MDSFEDRDDVLSANRGEDELSYDIALRPDDLDEYVGQTKHVENLKIFIEAAKKRGEPLDHVLFCGPPGLGKTTLANIIAKEMNVTIFSTSGLLLNIKGLLLQLCPN